MFDRHISADSCHCGSIGSRIQDQNAVNSLPCRWTPNFEAGTHIDGHIFGKSPEAWDPNFQVPCSIYGVCVRVCCIPHNSLIFVAQRRANIKHSCGLGVPGLKMMGKVFKIIRSNGLSSMNHFAYSWKTRLFIGHTHIFTLLQKEPS